MTKGATCLPLLLGLIVLLGPPAPVDAQEPLPLTVYYYRDGQVVAVSRPGELSGDVDRAARQLLEALLAGPSAAERSADLESALPAGASLPAVAVSGEQAVVDLGLPLAFLRRELDAVRCDAVVEQVVKTLHPLGLHRVQVRARDEAGTWLPLSDFFPRPQVPAPTVPPNDEPLPDRSGPAPAAGGQPPATGQGQPRGALTGKTVWLSAGHGWYWSDTLNRWTTQRGNTYGLVEDLSSAEAVNYYLARYLWNAGADVWLVRERGMNVNEVVVDNDAGTPAYSETGAWLTSATPGYQGGTYRWAAVTAAAAPAATATWQPDLPAAGWYAVWAWYLHGANRTGAARYEIHHAGGTTPVSLSQEVHGQTWRYLGEYYFEAGSAGRVTLVNAAPDTGQAVIADAIRFGGGRGSFAPPGGTSGRPRWEEQSSYWARFQGAPAAVYPNDVVARPLYAEWETARGAPGEAQNAVFVSWHTNAGGGTGSESYIHVTEPTPGSAALQDWVHAELVGDLRGAWNPLWRDRGQKAADFGELRELSTIPGILLEVAFHDTEDPGDADDLREPLFRQIAARAVYHGIAGYFAAGQAQVSSGRSYHPPRGLTAPVLLPEPPTRLVARNTAPGQVTVSWAAPACCDAVAGDAATAYKVYHSVDGRAFDDGRVTAAAGLAYDGLSPASLHFFRVTALNDGGESFPSPAVAARCPAAGAGVPFLIVDGFDRLDQAAMIPRVEAAFLGTVQRMVLEEMNSYSYAVEHGQALHVCGLAFDGTTDDALTAGDLALTGYAAVDWFTGEDAVADVSLADTNRAQLAAYLEGGGRLLLSGAEIGYDLVERGRDPAFYRDYLRASYLGDDAGTYDLAGVDGTPLAGLSARFDGGYDAGSPDRLGGGPGAQVVLSYQGGEGGGAAVAYTGSYRLVYAGFPLETIGQPAARNDLVCRAANFLLDSPVAPADGVQRLINPGFESGTGQAAWRIGAGHAYPVLAHRDTLPAGVVPRSGDWLAWLGGYAPGLTTTTALTQVVALPPGEPAARLGLAWLALAGPGARAPWAEDLTVAVYDLAGTLRATPLVVDGAAPAGTWQTGQFDLSAFAGQTVQLVLRARSAGTRFFVDDVSLLTQGPAGAAEFRGLWVDAYHPGLKSAQEVDALVEAARAGNLNALVVQVRRRGDTYYPSALDPWAADATPGWDALAYLLDRAHAAGLEVHAWIPALAIWGGDTPPAAPWHTFNRHGLAASGEDNWLMSSSTGALLAEGTYHLDPGHPAVADYVVALVAELAAYEDLDGLHLDRIRYPDQEWGYNPMALARFRAQTGSAGVPLPTDAAWLQWRREQVTALLRRAYLVATGLNPDLKVSAALSAAGSAPGPGLALETTTPYTAHLQDWRAWLEEGIVDLGLPMIYRDQDTAAVDFAHWIAWQKDHQYGRTTVTGLGLYRNDLADSAAQWRQVRAPSSLGHLALGACGYSYATPSDEGDDARALANALASHILTQTAPSPVLPWKTTPSRGHVLGQVPQRLACVDADGLVLALRGPENRTLVADGGGWFGAVDLPPGDYTLEVMLAGADEPLAVPLTVVAGRVAHTTVYVPSCAPYSVHLPLVHR